MPRHRGLVPKLQTNQPVAGGGVAAGDVVAVLGCGPVGLLTQLAARHQGARRVRLRRDAFGQALLGCQQYWAVGTPLRARPRVPAYRAGLHHITSLHTTSHHFTPHHITSHHITSLHTTSHHTTPRRITPHHVTPQVFAVDTVPERLAMAAELGATPLSLSASEVSAFACAWPWTP
jgi:hypothetical protein